MASMEIGIRLPDVARRTAEVREYAKAYRELGQAEKEFTDKKKDSNRVARDEQDIARAAKVTMRSEGVVLGARQTIQRRGDSEAARVDRMIMRSAVIGDALMSKAESLRGEGENATRGTSGPFSNLFGRRQRLIGPGGLNTFALVARAGMMLEKINPAAALAVAGMVAFAAGIAEATKRVNELGAASTESGGSMRQVGELAAFGISPGEIAGRAASLRSRLSSDPFAMMASAGGGPQLPPQFGSQNFAGTYLRALEALRRITNEEEQLRQARWLGVEADLAMIKTSDGVWKATREIGDLQGEIADPATVQATRDLGQSWENVKTATGGLLEEIAKPVIPLAAEGMKDLAGAIASTTSAIAPLFNTLGQTAQMLVDLSEGRFGKIWDELLGRDSGSGDAMKDHTEAMKDHTYMLRQGVYGGGPRARSAIPSELVGPMLRDELRQGQIRLGSF